jgi:uncharacterized RDD family membrane protein YckC
MSARHPVFLGPDRGNDAAAAGHPEQDSRLHAGDGRGSGLVGPHPPGYGGMPVHPGPRETFPRGGRTTAPTFYVAGFWQRLAAALIDLAVLAPVMLLLTWLAAVITGIHLPVASHRGFDFWLDMLLAGEPALLGGFGLAVAIALIYLFLFQAMTGHTLGMRVLRVQVIDLYGDSPSILRSAARTAAYLASVATLGLGFFWIGFDSEKRALHDWLAGTYVVKART